MTASTQPRYHAGQPNHSFYFTWARLVVLLQNQYRAIDLHRAFARHAPSPTNARVALPAALAPTLGLHFCGDVISVTLDSRGVALVVRPGGGHPNFLAEHSGLVPLPRLSKERVEGEDVLVLRGFALHSTAELSSAASSDVSFPFERVASVGEVEAAAAAELSEDTLAALKARYAAIEARLESRSVRSVYLTLDYARNKFDRLDLHEKTLAFFEAFLNHRFPLTLSAEL